MGIQYRPVGPTGPGQSRPPSKNKTFLSLAVALVLLVMYSSSPYSEDYVNMWKNRKLSKPVEGDYAAIGNPANFYRERFLVPLWVTDEQETKAQMHIRSLLHLSSALQRTLVLPNFGGGIPTLSNCRPYGFEVIYEVDKANNQRLWSVPYGTFKRFVHRPDRKELLSARTAIVFGRNTHKYVSGIPAEDHLILQQGCVDPAPFNFTGTGAPLYVGTEPGETLGRVASLLDDDVEVMFLLYNHFSPLEEDFIFDPLPQPRPRWGLWSGESFPKYNYSRHVDGMASAAVARLPEKYAGVQWRMELKSGQTLHRCANLFAQAIIAGCKERGIQTVYMASDAPIRDSGAQAKSGSFLTPSPEVHNSMSALLLRLEHAGLNVTSWDEVQPPADAPEVIEGLAGVASGVFDKLMLARAERLFVANPRCGFKSSYLGSIQTMRQDHFNTTSEDWEDLGMEWIGEPIEDKFWWNAVGDD